MIREARGAYVRDGSLTPAPTVRVGVGFGRDRVVALPAVVDTGSDLCVFPREFMSGPLPPGPRMEVLVDSVGARFPATAFFPTITAGDIRVSGVATIFPAGPESILGRSFLNRCDVRLSAERGFVLIRRVEPRRTQPTLRARP